MSLVSFPRINPDVQQIAMTILCRLFQRLIRECDASVRTIGSQFFFLVFLLGSILFRIFSRNCSADIYTTELVKVMTVEFEKLDPENPVGSKPVGICVVFSFFFQHCAQTKAMSVRFLLLRLFCVEVIRSTHGCSSAQEKELVIFRMFRCSHAA